VSNEFKGYDAWKTREPNYDEFEPEPKQKQDGRDAFIAALHDKIKTWTDEVAPRQFQWLACVGDYDLDDKVGQGATEVEAINDLLWQLGFEPDEGDEER
jgi:hypothetical protein